MLNVQPTFSSRTVLTAFASVSLLGNQPSVSHTLYKTYEWKWVASVLQGKIYVSSMTCLGKNTANIWIHQVALDNDRDGGTDLIECLFRGKPSTAYSLVANRLATMPSTFGRKGNCDCNLHL